MSILNREYRNQRPDNTGLLPFEKKEMINVFLQYPELERVVLFGSRAKGNFKKGSDIDIAVYGKKFSARNIIKLHDDLEEKAHVPYFFDVVGGEKISSQDLSHHIEVCGKEIWRK